MRRDKGLNKDIKELIEHVTVTIVKAEREEEFYRRWSESATQEETKAAMLQIAADIAESRMKLEGRREKLWRALEQFEAKGR